VFDEKADGALEFTRAGHEVKVQSADLLQERKLSYSQRGASGGLRGMTEEIPIFHSPSSLVCIPQGYIL
jgi:hypothetical protein